MAAAQRMTVLRVHAKLGCGGGDLVDVDPAHALVAQQSQHDFADLVLPEARCGTHHGQADRFAVGFLAAVAFDKGLAVLLLGGRRQGARAEGEILTTPVARIPKPSVDVGHGEHAAALQVRHGSGEVGLCGEIVRVIVVEGDLVPIVPMKANRQLEGIVETLHGLHAIARGAPRHHPGAQLAHPQRGVRATFGGQARPPACLASSPASIDRCRVEPIAPQDLPDGLAARFPVVSRLLKIARRNVEGQSGQTGRCGASDLDVLGAAPGIVHAHVEAGRTFSVPINSQELHRAPTVRVVAAVGEIAPPDPALHFARTSGQQDRGTIPQFGHGELRENHSAHGPIRRTIVDAQSPAQGAFPVVESRRRRDRQAPEVRCGRPSPSQAQPVGGCAEGDVAPPRRGRQGLLLGCSDTPQRQAEQRRGVRGQRGFCEGVPQPVQPDTVCRDAEHRFESTRSHPNDSVAGGLVRRRCAAARQPQREQDGECQPGPEVFQRGVVHRLKYFSTIHLGCHRSGTRGRPVKSIGSGALAASGISRVSPALACHWFIMARKRATCAA